MKNAGRHKEFGLKTGRRVVYTSDRRHFGSVLRHLGGSRCGRWVMRIHGELFYLCAHMSWVLCLSKLGELGLDLPTKR